MDTFAAADDATKTVTICIIFEDEEHTVHLIKSMRAAIDSANEAHPDKRPLRMAVWNVLRGGVLDITEPPPTNTLFFCRASGSAWTRAPGAETYVQTLLHWLHAHGAPVTARQPHTARHGADEAEARLVDSVGLDSQLVSNAACPV